MKVLRQETVAGEIKKFQFGNLKGRKWLVKNFTEGDIYVSFTENAKKEEMALIPAGIAQVIEAGERERGMKLERECMYVLTDTTNKRGVEVQLLEW